MQIAYHCTVVLVAGLACGGLHGGEPGQSKAIVVTKDTVALGGAQPAPGLLLASAAQGAISFSNGSTNALVPVRLFARNYAFRVSHGGQTNGPLDLVEFEITSRSATPFHWFCWENAAAYPHDFRLFTPVAGATYACYASVDGIRLFQVARIVDSDTGRTLFMSKRTGPDALPPLRNGLLGDAVGGEHFYGLNALYWTIIIDRLDVMDGELRVTLHGEKPEPQFTFALRGDKWEHVPTPPKRAK